MPAYVSPSEAATIAHETRPSKIALIVVGGAGVAWNVFGVVQFLETLRSTPESLKQMGMTAHQAEVYSSYPLWMTLAFAVGVFGGFFGSVLLLLRKGAATPVLGASLAGYIVLFIGDITEGVFAALGAPQIAILSTVVTIAFALFGWSRMLDRRGDGSVRRGLG